MLEKLPDFLSRRFDWRNLCGVCTDETPAMLASRSSVVALVKLKASNACSLHCMIHRQALASKRLQQALLEILDAVIRTVNFVKTTVLNSRFFRSYARTWTLFTKRFYSTFWLSTGNVVRHVVALGDEIKLFSFHNIQNKMDLLSD